MFIRTVIVCLCLLVVSNGIGYAQTASIEGIVLDAATSEPLPGAAVLLVQGESQQMLHGTTANLDGLFAITGVTSGAYTVVVRFIGYDEYRLPVTLTDAAPQLVTLPLEQVELNLNTIVVSASRQGEKLLDAPASVTILANAELVADVTQGAEMALRSAPGVEYSQVGIRRTHISLRGFNRSFRTATHVIADYRQTTVPGLGLVSFSSLPISPLDVARVEVVRGPGSALYGPGVDQGVVHFISKDPFSFPGTSVMISGGQRGYMQASMRHAGTFNNRVGYKVVGYYSQGNDFELDPNDPDDAAIIASIADNIVTHEGEVVEPLGERISDFYDAHLNAELSYRLRPGVTLTASGGYSQAKQTLFSVSGEIQSDGFPTAFGQLRLRANDLFAQAYWNGSFNEDRAFSYVDGQLAFNKSSEIGVQSQYNLQLAEGRQRLIFGLDSRFHKSDTDGRLHGRNENDDNFAQVGVYAQSETALSPQLDLILASRVDYHGATEETHLSPRASLVFKPSDDHSVRLSYNRAFSSAESASYYLDLRLGVSPLFDASIQGNQNGFTFGPLRTTSLFSGQRHDGVGVPIGEVYQVVLAGLTAPGALDGLPVPQRQAIEALLNSGLLNRSVGNGFSTGAMFAGGQFLTELNDIDPLKQEETNAFEVGYKGTLNNRLVLGVDVFYVRKANFVSTLQSISPLVLTSTLPEDLEEAVAGSFTPAELAPFGFTPELLAQFFSEGVEGLATPQGLFVAGVIEPNETYDPATRPGLLQTVVNYGKIDFYGIDLSAEVTLSDNLKVFGNYSWLSESLFDAVALGESNPSLSLSMNTPQNKFKAGFDYSTPSGFSVGMRGRYLDAYRVVEGTIAADIDAFFVLDAHLGYDLNNSVTGLRLDVTGQNILNNEHREWANAPKLGRMFLARLTYTL